MRRVYFLLAVLGGAGITALLAQKAAHSYARQEEASPPTPVPAAPSSSTLQYQGVASCAAAACHHGNGPPGTRGSEYTTWIAQNDPHSRAYAVLFDSRSLTIEKNLKGLKTLKEAQPHKNDLCLRCHVIPDVDTPHHHERFTQADGVGCESCHGPAEKWLSSHYTDVWKRKTPAEKQADGMTDTKNVAVRAQVCVRCHVGWQEADVNHDLIAAGHPRLRFEYGAYLANYPAKHWKVADDHARYRDFEARAWLLGQVISAKAAVELLQYRADPAHKKPWPEFAENSCFGCHHDLRDEQGRREPGAGRLSWGTWYFAMRSVVAGELRAARPADLKAFDKLEELMARNSPNRAQVTREAANLSRILDRWARELGSECREEKSLQEMLANLVKGGDNDGREWDRAAQRYLGIAAVYNALSDLDKRFRRDAQLKSAVRGLATRLGEAFPKAPGRKYDSPRDFKPDELQMDLRRLQEGLRRRGVP
jgi:hypothetical protein